MKQAIIKLHISILLAGATGLFGKWITLNEGLLVWYRMLLASVLFFFFMLITRRLRRVSLYDFIRIAGVGFLIALHWVFFYGSIKASNVSVGVVSFSTVGFFTALFEPLILKRKISLREFIYSFISLLGVCLIFSLDVRYRLGIGLGVTSGALASLFTIYTKRVGSWYPAGTIFLYEMTGGFLVLSLFLPFYLHYFPVETLLPGWSNFWYLLVFVIACTICLQLLQIQVLRKISAFTVNLSYNLEPVYSIVLAMIFFGEAKELSIAFYAGVGLIVLSVLLQSLRVKKESIHS